MPKLTETLGTILQDVVMPAGATPTSSVADLQGHAIAGIAVPAGLVGTAITLEVSIDDGATFLPLVDTSNTALSLTVGATAAYINLRSVLPMGIGRVRIKSNGTETADRKFTFVGQATV